MSSKCELTCVSHLSSDFPARVCVELTYYSLPRDQRKRVEALLAISLNALFNIGKNLGAQAVKRTQAPCTRAECLLFELLHPNKQCMVKTLEAPGIL